MATTERIHSIELKADRISNEVFLILLLGILFFGLFYFAVHGTIKRFHMCLPFLILLGFWLLIYIPYSIYLQITSEIDTINFNSENILIINNKLDIYETIKWSTITEILITKRDAGNKPEEITIISTDIVRTINLKLYSTIFTTTEEIWVKIQNLYMILKNSSNCT